MNTKKRKIITVVERIHKAGEPTTSYRLLATIRFPWWAFFKKPSTVIVVAKTDDDQFERLL